MEDGALTMVPSGSSMLTCGRESGGVMVVAAVDAVVDSSILGEDDDDGRQRIRSGACSVGWTRGAIVAKCCRGGRSRRALCVGEGGEEELERVRHICDGVPQSWVLGHVD